MDQTATPSTPAPTGHATSMMDTITTLNLMLIALAAAVVLLAIGYGMRQRRRRRTAERAEAARLDAHAVEPAREPLAPATTAGGVEEPRPLVGGMPAPANRSADVLAKPAAPVEAGPAPEAAAGAAPDETSLTRIKGLGPRVQARLGELGITRIDQLAALTDDQAEALDAHLGPFRGRIARDRWVEQARFLATGDVKGFEAVFGRL